MFKLKLYVDFKKLVCYNLFKIESLNSNSLNVNTKERMI